MSIFLTSHDLHEVDQLASRVVILDRGRVVAGGTPEVLKRGVGGAGIELAFQQFATIAGIQTALAGWLRGRTSRSRLMA